MATIGGSELRSFAPGIFAIDVVTTFLIRNVRWWLSSKQYQEIAF
jgi:hypothetical protein